MLQTKYRVLNASDAECIMRHTKHKVLIALDTPQSA